MKQIIIFILVTGVVIFGLNGSVFSQAPAFNHSLYDKVLKEFVEDGRVDYRALQDNPALLDAYLKKLAETSPASLFAMPEDEKIAFYINAYNAMTLKAVTDHYPVKSIKKIRGVWDRLKFTVAGRELTLDHIKNKILRWEFREPRVHFALVCAAIGCPKLRSGAYRGRELNRMLNEETRKFINDKERVNLDKDKKTLYVSSIFKWFKNDFGDIAEFVAKYMPKDEARFIRENRPRIKYLKYDWALNKRSE